MRHITEENWRIQFWNTWEDWEDYDDQQILNVFKTPGAYMRWAEKSNADLKCFAPWEFALTFGTDALMDYLYYLAGKEYWETACHEWFVRLGVN